MIAFSRSSVVGWESAVVYVIAQFLISHLMKQFGQRVGNHIMYCETETNRKSVYKFPHCSILQMAEAGALTTAGTTEAGAEGATPASEGTATEGAALTGATIVSDTTTTGAAEGVEGVAGATVGSGACAGHPVKTNKETISVRQIRKGILLVYDDLPSSKRQAYCLYIGEKPPATLRTGLSI